MTILPYFVYILTNDTHSVFFVDVTNNLKRIVYEHKHHLVAGVTGTFNLSKLVYFEYHKEEEQALTREKIIKAGTRKKKMQLIESINQRYKDLSDEI